MTFIPVAAVRGSKAAAKATAKKVQPDLGKPQPGFVNELFEQQSARRSEAADMAAELRAGGATKAYVTQTLRDEFGLSIAVAGNLFDQAEGPTAPRTPVVGPAVGAGFTGTSKAITSSGGGMLLGAFGYVLVLTYFRDGLPGLKKWFRAKFLNQVNP